MDLTSRGQNRPAGSCENTLPTVWVPQNVGNSSTSTSVVELATHSFSLSRDQHSIFYCLLGRPRNECRGRNSADGIVANLRARPGLRTCGMHVHNGRRHLLLSQFSFIYFALPASLYCEEYVNVYALFWLSRDCIWITVATKWYWQLNIFTEIGNRAPCRLDIYHWGAGLAVTLDKTYNLLFEQE
jgi:hypothetical protein